MWYSYHKKNQNNKDSFSSVLNEIVTFDTVENFWRSYNNLIPIEYLPSNTDFFMFKDYIKPEWEDIKNKKGGRWIYDIAWDKSKHHLISQHTEQVWLKLVKKYKIRLIFNIIEYYLDASTYRKPLRRDRVLYLRNSSKH